MDWVEQRMAMRVLKIWRAGQTLSVDDMNLSRDAHRIQAL